MGSVGVCRRQLCNYAGNRAINSPKSLLLECVEVLLQLNYGVGWHLLVQLLSVLQSSEFELQDFERC